MDSSILRSIGNRILILLYTDLVLLTILTATSHDVTDFVLIDELAARSVSYFSRVVLLINCVILLIVGYPERRI